MDALSFQDFSVNSNVSQSRGSNAEFRPSGKIGSQEYPNTNKTSVEGKSGFVRRNFFSFEYYQQYFDVDTDQVYSRILNSMVPRFGSNFIANYIQPIPDLYGPIWVCITLVFTTAICGNLAKYIETSGDVQNETYNSDFRLITGASTLIACYVIVIPFALYSLLWYRKSETQYSYLEFFCAYGYSLSIFIPVSVLWVINVQLFRWLLILVSVVASGTVLATSVWSALKTDRSRLVSLGTVFCVLFLHCLLAVAFKQYYFDVSQSVRKPNPYLLPVSAATTEAAKLISVVPMNAKAFAESPKNKPSGNTVKVKKVTKEDHFASVRSEEDGGKGNTSITSQSKLNSGRK